MTPEQVRFHAAGHLAAAYELAGAGKSDAARYVLQIVGKYMDSNRVDCPPPMRLSVDEYATDPAAHLSDIKAMEDLFTHPANALLEQAGIRLGS